MDIKFVKALCLAYGNYRAAIAVVDEDDSEDKLPLVVATGKALLALQDALGVEVADSEQVEIAIDEARNAYIEYR